jgi:hypothetical protein
MGRVCSPHGDEKDCIQVLIGKSEGKRPLGRIKHRWEGNIKTDFREIGWGGMDQIDLAQDRDHWVAVVNTVMKFRGP